MATRFNKGKMMINEWIFIVAPYFQTSPDLETGLPQIECSERVMSHTLFTWDDDSNCKAYFWDGWLNQVVFWKPEFHWSRFQFWWHIQLAHYIFGYVWNAVHVEMMTTRDKPFMFSLPYFQINPGSFGRTGKISWGTVFCPCVVRLVWKLKLETLWIVGFAGRSKMDWPHCRLQVAGTWTCQGRALRHVSFRTCWCRLAVQIKVRLFDWHSTKKHQLWIHVTNFRFFMSLTQQCPNVAGNMTHESDSQTIVDLIKPCEYVLKPY